MVLLYESVTILFQAIELLIVVRILLSILNIRQHNLITSLVYEITEPILGPARNLIEKLGIRTGMFDFAPLLAILFLRTISKIIRTSLM